MNNTVILSSDACLGHNPGPHHPESPERLLAVREALSTPEFESVPWIHAPLGTKEQLLLVHTPEYVNRIATIRPKAGYVPLDGGDTVMSPGTWDCVMTCVGRSLYGRRSRYERRSRQRLLCNPSMRSSCRTGQGNGILRFQSCRCGDSVCIR